MPPEAIEKLATLLAEARIEVIDDPGRCASHRCTFCNAAPEPIHPLCDIGRYPNGKVITRPVCAACKPWIPIESVTPLADLIDAEITKALRIAKGSAVKAARMLKIGRATVYRKIDNYKKRVAA